MRLIAETILPLQNKHGIYVGYLCEIYENRWSETESTGKYYCTSMWHFI